MPISGPKLFGALFRGLLFFTPLLAGACNVPVFRYALERWPPDAYELVVFHREPLSTNQQAVLEAWGGAGELGMANLAIERVNISGEIPAPRQALWKAQTNAMLPWAVVLYPAGKEIEQPVWAGPLESKSLNLLLDSPVRRDIARRLSKGDSAVWLLLESGNKSRDDALAALLEGESKKLEKSLQLPEAAPDDPQIRSGLPLKIAFSTVRLPRTASAEQMLINMLLHIDPEIARSTEPMLFGVFGRGRALPPLLGKDITASVLGEVAEFLTGACSCQVKELNPGFDLLLAYNWEGSLEGKVVKDPELPPLMGMSQILAVGTNTPTTALSPTNANPVMAPGRRLAPTLWVAFLAGIAVLVIGTVWLKSKRRIS